MKTQLKIEGMTCGHCVAAVRNALQALPNTEAVEVSLEGWASVESAAPVAAMIASVEEEGYTAKVA